MAEARRWPTITTSSNRSCAGGSDGPVVAGDLRQRPGPKGTWWDWDDGKLALECLFWADG